MQLELLVAASATLRRMVRAGRKEGGAPAPAPAPAGGRGAAAPAPAPADALAPAGVPSALAAHPRFVAIGTSRSLVFLFERASQALRAIISRTTVAVAAPGGVGVPLAPVVAAAASGADGAVTSLDAVPGLDFLLIG
jgi:hypothetical protein